MSVKYHNVTFVQPVCKKEYTAPAEVVRNLYENGMYVTSAMGKYMQVCRYVNGKSKYVGMLASFVKGTTKYSFRNGDTRTVTLGNLKAL